MGSANTANADGRCGSNVYEVNHWLWMFGRGKPRLGGLSVAGKNHKFSEISLENEILRKVFSKKMVF